MADITQIDVLQLATNVSYAYQLQSITNASVHSLSILAHDQSFITDVLGTNVSQRLVSSLPWDAWHEAGVCNIATKKIYATSNWAGSLQNPINITILDPQTDEVTSASYEDVDQANGGCAYYPPGVPSNSSEGQAIVFADSADYNHRSKLTVVDPSTNKTQVLLNSFYGCNFSSINDTRATHTGKILVPNPRFHHTYRFEPLTGHVQAVADDFIAPNGLEFTPDNKHIYVTDTGVRTWSADNLTHPATVYRFDITADGKRLQNRQLFAYADQGIPDGKHTDTKGYVYSASSDGVHVRNPSGQLVGKFGVGGKGSNNFVFVPGGLYIFNAFKLWFVVSRLMGGR